jgi:hypothetical protein
MSTRNAKSRQWTSKERIALAFTGVLVMALGAGNLLQGKLHYQNYWHAPVFAPFALFVGVLIIFVAIKGRGF